MKKRGQAATEFLTKYGWSVMFVLGFVVLLFYQQNYRIENDLPDYCGLEINLNCIDVVRNDEGHILMVVKNNLAVDITNINVSMPSCNGRVIEPKYNINSLKQKESAHYKIDCSNLLNNQLSETVYFYYTNLQTGLKHKVTGRIII